MHIVETTPNRLLFRQPSIGGVVCVVLVMLFTVQAMCGSKAERVRVPDSLMAGSVTLIVKMDKQTYFAGEDVLCNIIIVNTTDHRIEIPYPDIWHHGLVIYVEDQRGHILGSSTGFVDIRIGRSYMPLDSGEIYTMNLHLSSRFGNDPLTYASSPDFLPGTYRVWASMENAFSSHTGFSVVPISDAEQVIRYQFRHNILAANWAKQPSGSEMRKLTDMIDKHPQSAYLPKLYNQFFIASLFEDTTALAESDRRFEEFVRRYPDNGNLYNILSRYYHSVCVRRGYFARKMSHEDSLVVYNHLYKLSDEWRSPQLRTAIQRLQNFWEKLASAVVDTKAK